MTTDAMMTDGQTGETGAAVTPETSTVQNFLNESCETAATPEQAIAVTAHRLPLEQHIALLSLNDSDDDWAEAWEMICAAKESTRRAEEQFKAIAEERVRESGPFTLGFIKWYLGRDKKTKCRDASKTINTILQITDGDEARLIGCLSANWAKHGTIKRLLAEFGQPQVYGELFEEIEVESVQKDDASPKDARKLKNTDTRYIG